MNFEKELKKRKINIRACSVQRFIRLLKARLISEPVLISQ